MKKNKADKSIKLRDIENLLHDQTLVILSAVDERMQKSEERVNRKIEKLN